MSVDREYRIRIVTSAEGDGVRRASEDFEQAGKQVEIFNAHGKETHRLIHTLDEIAPGLGFALRAATNPENIGVAGLVIILKEVVELMGEWKKRADEAAEAQAKLDTDKWSAMADYVREAARATAELKTSMDSAASSAETLLQKDQQALDVLEKQLALKLKLAGSEGEKAALEGIGFEQRIAQMEANRRSAEQAAAAAQGRFQSAADARAAGPMGAENIPEIRAWLDAHKDDVVKAQAAYSAAKAENGGLTPERLLQMAEERQRVLAQHMPESEAAEDPLVRDLQKRSSRLTRLGGALDQARSAENERRNVLAAYDRATKQLADAESEAAQEVQRLKKAAADSANAIEHERAVHTAEEGLTRAAAISEAGLAPGALGNTLYDVASGFRRRAAGGAMSAREQQLAQRLFDAMRAQGETPEQISMLVTRLTDMHITLAQQIKAINAELKSHSQRMTYMGNNPT